MNRSVTMQWVRFDGNIPHATLPFTGTFFTQQSHMLLPTVRHAFHRISKPGVQGLQI
jgi:hypothetical protein